MFCIYCNAELTTSIKEWYYRNDYYKVKLFKCSNCGKCFRAYYHDHKFSHTIPKYVGIKGEIIHYLETHGFATKSEIAKTCSLDVKEVADALRQLKKEGIVSS